MVDKYVWDTDPQAEAERQTHLPRWGMPKVMVSQPNSTALFITQAVRMHTCTGTACVQLDFAMA